MGDKETTSYRRETLIKSDVRASLGEPSRTKFTQARIQSFCEDVLSCSCGTSQRGRMMSLVPCEASVQASSPTQPKSQALGSQGVGGWALSQQQQLIALTLIVGPRVVVDVRAGARRQDLCQGGGEPLRVCLGGGSAIAAP